MKNEPVQAPIVPEPISSWVLNSVRNGNGSNQRAHENSEFDECFPTNWAALPTAMQLKLVSQAIELFLRLQRTARNRHTVETLIAAVSDINLCPEIGCQTLLEYVCGGSGEVDLGLAKALLKAGHALDRAPRGGVTPWQALENLYASKSRYYDKCRILFQIAKDKASSDASSPKRLRRCVSGVT